MRTKGADGVGRITVDVEVANNDDLALVRRGMLQPDQVRRRPAEEKARCPEPVAVA